MNPETAIQLLSVMHPYMSYTAQKAIDTATEALHRQIAEKPNLEGDGYDDSGNINYDTWICPGCGERYELDYEEYDCCPKCGQKIDWSDVK